MTKKMQELVDELREEGHSKQDIMAALCDGEYLAAIDATQDEVEDAHAELKSLTEYRIFERPNSCASGGSAKIVYTDSLSKAKRRASQGQVFIGTIMVIEYANGLPVSHKENGKWQDNEWHS